MRARALEALIVLGVVGMIVAMLVPAANQARAAKTRMEQNPIQPDYGIHSVKHDGHWFISARTSSGFAFIHHPACKCRLTDGPIIEP